jgi:hypothetical protein
VTHTEDLRLLHDALTAKFKAFSEILDRRPPLSLIQHRSDRARLPTKTKVTANRLRTDELGRRDFQRMAQASKELPQRSSEKTDEYLKRNPSSRIFLVALPGLTLHQAKLLKKSCREAPTLSTPNSLGAEAVESWLEEVLRRASQAEGKTFSGLTIIERNLFSDLRPTQLTANRWELRSLATMRLPHANPMETVATACAEGKVLRFVYRPDYRSEGVTHRVTVRSLYGVDGKLTLFRGEVGDRIRSYSLERCSAIVVEDTPAKYRLPILTIELIAGHSFDKITFSELIHEA